MEKSLVYEVNIDLDAKLVKEFETWLMPHIKQVLATGAFLKAQAFRRDSASAGQVGYTLHYLAKTGQVLDEYLTDKAPALRKDAENRFGGHFTAFRRVLKEF